MKDFNKLILSIIIDLVGMGSYLVPAVGEFVDVVWAPISGFLIYWLFRNKAFAIVGFFEEFIPVTDFIPSATLAWAWNKYFQDK